MISNPNELIAPLICVRSFLYKLYRISTLRLRPSKDSRNLRNFCNFWCSIEHMVQQLRKEQKKPIWDAWKSRVRQSVPNFHSLLDFLDWRLDQNDSGFSAIRVEILRAQKALFAATARPNRLAATFAIPFVLVLSVEQFRIVIILRNEVRKKSAHSCTRDFFASRLGRKIQSKAKAVRKHSSFQEEKILFCKNASDLAAFGKDGKRQVVVFVGQLGPFSLLANIPRSSCEEKRSAKLATRKTPKERKKKEKKEEKKERKKTERNRKSFVFFSLSPSACKQLPAPSHVRLHDATSIRPLSTRENERETKLFILSLKSRGEGFEMVERMPAMPKNTLYCFSASCEKRAGRKVFLFQEKQREKKKAREKQDESIETGSWEIGGARQNDFAARVDLHFILRTKKSIWNLHVGHPSEWRTHGFAGVLIFAGNGMDWFCGFEQLFPAMRSWLELVIASKYDWYWLMTIESFLFISWCLSWKFLEALGQWLQCTVHCSTAKDGVVQLDMHILCSTSFSVPVL